MQRALTRGWIQILMLGLQVAGLFLASCSGETRSLASGSFEASPTVEAPALAAPSATAAPTGTPAARLTFPDLTDQQRDVIRAIVANDARFRQLVSSSLPDFQTTLTTTEVVLWQDNALNVLGGVITLELPQPSTIDGEWLASFWIGRGDGSTEAPYRSARYRATVAGVTGLRVFVDLEQQVVAGIDPDGRSLTVIDGPEYLDPLPDMTRTPD